MERFRQALDRVQGRSTHGRATGVQEVRRDDIDDMARAALGQNRCKNLHAMGDGPYVQLGTRFTRIANEPGRPQLDFDGSGELTDFGQLTHIPVQRDTAKFFFPQPLERKGESHFVPVNDRDLHPLLRGAQREREPDATRGPIDYRNFVCKVNLLRRQIEAIHVC
jgi:hypothetical protein